MFRSRLSPLVISCILLAVSARAHLCNDVFVQAQDNLAVKVDIRDGQLRIGEAASFRVYLLNTMDRGIASIQLEVQSDEFNAEITPSPDWKQFPSLQTAKQGGQKVYFNVKLARKPGVGDGRYNIGLRLVNGNDSKMEFKTVDLSAAASLHELPKSTGIQIDGVPKRAEWENAVLCTDFYEYVKGQYFENKPTDMQSRFRVAADDEYLYFLLGFVGGEDATSDVCTLYVAPTADVEPKAVHINRVTGAVEGLAATDQAVVRKCEEGDTLECRIPRAALGIQGNREFLLNFTRTVRTQDQESVTYWRGNSLSYNSPVVYDKFVLPWQ